MSNTLDNFIRDSLTKAENNLNENDYVKYCNNIKKVFENLKVENEVDKLLKKNKVEDGFYKLDYNKDILWKPPEHWNKTQIYYILKGDMNIPINIYNDLKKIGNYNHINVLEDICSMRFKYLNCPTDNEEISCYCIHWKPNLNFIKYKVDIMEDDITYFISSHLPDNFNIQILEAFIKPILKSGFL